MTAAPMRDSLRAATSAVHARLHRHSGLSAAASGVIEIDLYRALLIRLYGFHRAFDASIEEYAYLLGDDTPSRSSLIESDLSAFGVAPEGVPLCEKLPRVRNEAQALGALYVVEGSSLGGAIIANALKPVLAPLKGAGCRFFSNDGAKRGGWRRLLAKIETLHGQPELERAATDAAISTFQLFEDWMRDWAPEPARPPVFPPPENRRAN